MEGLPRLEDVAEGPLLLQILNLFSEVVSLSDVAEPPALAKSRQKALLSNFTGKLSFSRTVASGRVLSLLLKEEAPTLLLSWLLVTVVEVKPPCTLSDVFSRVSLESTTDSTSRFGRSEKLSILN